MFSHICSKKLLPPPSEFCIDEDNSVIRSAIDAWRNKKKTFLNVTVLFFCIFNLILDASRTAVRPFFDNLFLRSL
jgi:hypothetical protein